MLPWDRFVLNGSKLLLSLASVTHHVLGKGEHIEHKHLHLDTVDTARGLCLPLLVCHRYCFFGHVEREESTTSDLFHERDRECVLRDVSSRIQQLPCLRISLFTHCFGDLTVLHHSGFPRPQRHHSYSLFRVGFDNNFVGAVSFGFAAKSHKRRVRNFDKHIVYSVYMNILQFPFAHICQRPRGCDSCVEAPVAVRRHGQRRS
mmetsp:Transcript_38602/g.75946  ORF Transcript_38602/g.75946 Transcript_38602/m.75946 type:complete len:203 (-) Transcript_38602:653-1261(-)